MWLVATSVLRTAFIALFAYGSFAANNLAPPLPNKAWYPEGLNKYEAELASGNMESAGRQVTVDPDKVYDLPALIDLAERANPQTRIAWERARQAADAVGLSQSAYFPFLVASASAGYEKAFIPFPTLKVGPGPTNVSVAGSGNLTTDAALEKGVVEMKWLLFDFGERKAATTMAREQLMMANVGFNAVHQQLVFVVTQSYYQLNTARQKMTVAESSLSAAETVRRAAQERLDNGLETKPQALQAEQQSAQAAFELEAAKGAFSDAQVALVQSLGIRPTTKLQVVETTNTPVGEVVLQSSEELIDRALSQRPDLVARLANVREKRAQVKKARAAYYPKVSLDANAGWANMDVMIGPTPFLNGNELIYGGGIAIDLPLFEGFARSKKLRIAESELKEAEYELAGSRDAVVQEVWKARTDLETALRKQESAARLRTAAESAFAASLDAYRHGVGTYIDVASAQQSATMARSTVIDTRSAIYTSIAALALSVGDLGRQSPKNSAYHRR
jgi:outer membrane protein TolC